MTLSVPTSSVPTSSLPTKSLPTKSLPKNSLSTKSLPTPPDAAAVVRETLYTVYQAHQHCIALPPTSARWTRVDVEFARDLLAAVAAVAALILPLPLSRQHRLSPPHVRTKDKVDG